MERLQKQVIARDLDEKIVFLTGPRQVGKTTLAKSFASMWPHLYYLNYDAEQDRTAILKQTWDRHADLIVLDELHKLKHWKRRIKGVYDTEGISPRLLITGSARLDVFRRGGDSLAGRTFLHHLLPFSVRELRGEFSPQQGLDHLMRFGGFPEPLMHQSEQRAKRWRKQHMERIVREDVQDLEPVRDIQSLLLLVELLRERVGSPISYASLARDIEVSPHTIKDWIHTLESMYVLFQVTPYHRNLARAILKEPKIYFYDVGAVRGDEGIKLENTVAVCLKKWTYFLEDGEGYDINLHTVRDKDRHEVDFLITKEGKADMLIEVKYRDEQVHKPLVYFNQRLKPTHAIQLVYGASRVQTIAGVSILPAAAWLDQLDV